MGNPSPRCTAEFKAKAVELYRSAGADVTYAEIARSLGCDAGKLVYSLAKRHPALWITGCLHGLLQLLPMIQVMIDRFAPLLS